VITVKAKVNLHSDQTPTVPIVVPDLDQVRQFAKQLHAESKPWTGEAFGWSAEYNPKRPEPPLDSKLKFTPADFCIGESGIWFFSMMWEHGDDKPPVEFLDDRNIVK
jgi:hypothetical protein